MLGIFKNIFGRNDDLSHEENVAKQRLQKLRDRKVPPHSEGDDAASSFRDLVQAKTHEPGTSPFSVWTGMEQKAHSVGLTNNSMVRPFKGGAFGFSENPLQDDIDMFNRENFVEGSEKKKSRSDFGRAALANLLSRHGQIERNLDPELGSSGQYDIVVQNEFTHESVLASDWSASESLFGGTGLFCEYSDTLTLPARTVAEPQPDRAKCFGPPVDLNKLEKPKAKADETTVIKEEATDSEDDYDFVDEVLFHYDNSESLFDQGDDEITPNTIETSDVEIAAETVVVRAPLPPASPATTVKPASPVKAEIATKKTETSVSTPAVAMQTSNHEQVAPAVRLASKAAQPEPIAAIPVEKALVVKEVAPVKEVVAVKKVAVPEVKTTPVQVTATKGAVAAKEAVTVKDAVTAKEVAAAKEVATANESVAAREAVVAKEVTVTKKPAAAKANPGTSNILSAAIEKSEPPAQPVSTPQLLDTAAVAGVVAVAAAATTAQPANAAVTKRKELTRIEDPTSSPRTKEEKKNLLLSDLCDSMEIKQFSHPYDKFSESSLKLIAQNPKTPTGALAWLAAHRNPHIRAAVAKNPVTPIETFWVLARDHESSIRYSIAENLYMSPEILRELSRDRNPLIATTAQNALHSVRESLMNALPPSTIYGKKSGTTGQSMPAAKASGHTSPAVSKVEPEAQAQQGDEEFLLMIARKTTTPARRLKELANHSHSAIRAAVAENANTPQDVLWLMARDSDPTVKIRLSANCNLPEEILDILKEDKDGFVAKAALKMQNKLAGLRFTGDAGGNDIRHILTWP